MNKIWTSLTAIAVATALQPLHMASATQVSAARNLPVVSELTVTELPTQEALPQLPESKVAVNQPSVQQAAVFSFVSEPEAKLSITAATVGSMFKQYQEQAQLSDLLPQPSKLRAEKLTSPSLEPSDNVGSDNLDLPEMPEPATPKILATQVGGASWYGYEGGTVTATGERYNPQGLSAAHRTLPFGSKVLVTNVRNNQSVIVRINDRGPFTRGRIIDLSEAAAAEVGIKSTGVGNVRIDVLSYGDGQRKSRR